MANNLVNRQAQLHVELRMRMKKLLFNAISSAINPFTNTALEGSGFLVAGSTVITIARQQGYCFRMHAQKSGDLDLYLYMPGGKFIANDLRTYQRLHAETVPEFFKKLINDGNTGFDFVSLDGVTTDSPDLKKAFVIRKFFSEEEARIILSEDEFNEYWKGFQTTKVCMEIDPINTLPLFLLNPIRTTHFTGNSVPIYVDNYLNFLAQKLARACTINKFTPFETSSDPAAFQIRDLIDIYNLSDHWNRRGLPNLFDLEPTSPSNDLETLRVLMIVNFVRFGLKPESIFLNYYVPTEENRDAFKKGIVSCISDDVNLNTRTVDNILHSVRDTLCGIFPSIQKGGTIELSEEENEFISTANGYVALPSGSVQQIQPSINTDLLVKTHRGVFTKHPELKDRIAQHPTLKAHVERIIERRNELKP